MYLQHFTTFGTNCASFYLFRVTPGGGLLDMVAYEFYWPDEEGKEHLIGILPERRKKPERITKGSILNWVKNVLGDNEGIKNVYFIQVEI